MNWINFTLDDYITESNAIEGEYSVEAFYDHKKAWDYLVGQEKLTKEVILKTHELLMKNLWLEIAGKFRTVNVRVGDDIKRDWQEVPRLITSLLEWKPRSGIDILNWHIAYEGVHPFRDGNGRTGRLFMLWHFFKNNLNPIIIRDKDKWGYYSLFK